MVTPDTNKRALKTIDLAYISIFAALIAICSWIAVPTAVPFTMQTFAVFVTILVLGGRRGFFAVLTYIMLGAAGVPVFAGFTGGIGILLGMTGGYIIGFLFCALVYQLAEHFISHHIAIRITALVIGLIVCYAFGTAWFMVVYSKSYGHIGLGTALTTCVIPFILPDLIKLCLAISFASVLKKRIRL